MNRELAAAVEDAMKLLDTVAMPAGSLYVRLQLLEATRRHATKAVGEAEEQETLRLLRLDTERVRESLKAVVDAASA